MIGSVQGRPTRVGVPLEPAGDVRSVLTVFGTDFPNPERLIRALGWVTEAVMAANKMRKTRQVSSRPMVMPSVVRETIISAGLELREQHEARIEPAFGELFPLLSSLARDRELRRNNPLHDVFVFFRIHVTTSAVPGFDALVSCGLDPANCIFFFKDYPYPHGDVVVEALRRRGARVHPDSEMSQRLVDSMADNICKHSLRMMTIEDGAHVVEMIMRNDVLASRWIGGTEQTTRGTWTIDRLHKEGKIKVPVIALSNSRIKSDFEGPRIAASALHACLNLFSHSCIKDWNVAVIGAGTIGRHTIAAFEDHGCTVSSFDSSATARLLIRHLPVRVCRSAEEAIVGADLILGTTGKESITRDVMAATSGHTRIASLSSERAETDRKFLAGMAHRTERLHLHPAGFPDNPIIGTRHYLPPNGSRMIDVLFDGFPINFSSFGILCEQNADLIVAWLILCGLEVANGTFSGETGALKTAADIVFAKHDLAAQYERIWA